MKTCKKLTLSVVLLLFTLLGCSQSAHQLDADQFQEKLMGAKKVQLIDVRTPEEFKGGYIADAINIDFNAKDFEQRISGLKKNEPVHVYCLSGGRSQKAAALLRKKGFEVYELHGGIMRWKAENKPLTKSDRNTKGMSSIVFNQSVNEKRLVLVDFYAKWCGPCKVMAPYLEELKTEHHQDLSLLKIDADVNSLMVDSLRVQALPTLHLFKDGKQVWTHTGMIEKAALQKVIAEHL